MAERRVGWRWPGLCPGPRGISGKMVRRAGILAGAGVLAAGIAGAAESDCARLSAHFMLCDAGSPWAAAEWEQFGDGATLHLGPLSLDFTEGWAGRGDHGDLSEALAALLAEGDEDRERNPHGTDLIETGPLRIARSLDTHSFEDEAPLLRATMIAEGAAGARILLLLTAPGDTAPEEIERQSRALAELVQPGQES